MISRIRPALRELGAGALYQYALYQMGLRSGRLRKRTRAYGWGDRPLETWLNQSTNPDQALSFRAPFFFEPGASLDQSLKEFPLQSVLREADEILAGKFRLFGGSPVSLGMPPNWGKVPLSSASVSLERHWIESERDADVDLRLAWEPSRFGWAFTLCRAYLRTGETRYAEGTVALIQSWRDRNAPNMGPHWASGQECALRALALIFAWHALSDFLADHPEAARMLLEMTAAHAERIPPTLSYARAQRNNHLLTEAVGLYSVGSQMPFFAKAAEWKQMGRQMIVRTLHDQVFADGGYIQYSSNYHRLALGAGLWASRLAAIHGEPLPVETLDELTRMTEFLIALVDPATGQPPNWGHNDGSNLLPLADGENRDYRPTVQAAAREFMGRPSFDPGVWDELSAWLGLRTDGAPSEAGELRAEFPEAGLYVMRGGQSRGILRCAQFKARPSHSDQLHFDLWWNGHNIAQDPGTYRYTALPPWDNALVGSEAHNTMQVDGKEPMDRAGRFLWLNWSNARFLGRWQAEDGSIQAMAAEHPMRTGMTHRRSIVHAGESLWVVMDELIGSVASKARHRARLLWNLIDWPWELEGNRLVLQGDQGPVRLRITPHVDSITLYRAGELVGGETVQWENAEVMGWWAPTYGYKEASLALVATLEGQLPLRLTSWWRLGDIEPQDLMLEWDSLTEDPLMAFLSSG